MDPCEISAPSIPDITYTVITDEPLVTLASIPYLFTFVHQDLSSSYCNPISAELDGSDYNTVQSAISYNEPATGQFTINTDVLALADPYSDGTSSMTYNLQLIGIVTNKNGNPVVPV